MADYEFLSNHVNKIDDRVTFLERLVMSLNDIYKGDAKDKDKKIKELEEEQKELLGQIDGFREKLTAHMIKECNYIDQIIKLQNKIAGLVSPEVLNHDNADSCDRKSDISK